MLKFIIYEDNADNMNFVVKSVNLLPILKNIDYKIVKFNGYDEKINDLIEDDSDRKIYLLDVEVPFVSGLELASKIREDDWQSVIIFITAYKIYKDDIIYSRLGALDFMLKSHFSQTRFEETVAIAIKILEHKRYLIFKSKHVDYQIEYDNILYIEKLPLAKKCLIVSVDGFEIEVCKTLNELLNTLGKKFYQTHKSCIVNVTKIKQISIRSNKIVFVNGKEIDLLSTRRKKGLKEYVKLYK